MVRYISRYNVTFLLIIISFFLQSCQFEASKVKIERFEFLDEKTGKDFYKEERFKHLNKQLISKAYIVYGYKKKYDHEINQIIDQFLCDSILPNLHFERKFYVQFFKVSRNTNREKFEERLSERKMVNARSHDLLLHFRLFHPNDSTMWIAKQKAGLWRPDPPEEKFYCQ